MHLLFPSTFATVTTRAAPPAMAATTLALNHHHHHYHRCRRRHHHPSLRAFPPPNIPRSRGTTTCPSRSNTSPCRLSLDSERSDPAAAAAAPSSSPSSTAAELRVAFACGGTSGHIYAAIAMAEALESARPDAKILFIGSAAGAEATVVPSAGYAYSPAVPPARLSRPLFSPCNILFPFQLVRSVVASWRALLEFRPHAVVGTGGYVAAPVCLAAALLPGVKLFIQEQNSYPGLANRVIAPFADKIFLAFNGCVKHFEKKKCAVYGNPVRLQLRRYASQAVARSHFFPKIGPRSGEQKPEVVLILGGSDGAAPINVTVLNMYYEMLLEHKNRYIIWQTGADGFSEMESLVRTSRRLLLTPFLNEVNMAYAAADVVVSRAGAMTCTEILTTGKPSILIPFSDSADDHQLKNAYIMADIAGSKVITEDELDSSSLGDAIDEILGNEKLMADMSERALKVALPNAATNIVQCMLSIVKASPRQ